MTRFLALSALLATWCNGAMATDAATERAAVQKWRAERVSELTSDTGWLTLVGLFWLDKGTNSFGRAASNHLVLDHPSLPALAGTFEATERGARFTAKPDAAITLDGKQVTRVEMLADQTGSPTVLASGSLRFFIIERGGKMGVRVRDVDSPRRRNFTPIEYYPVDTAWALSARFEPYDPHRRIRIVNILGMEEEMDSPGALVFTKEGREWRLDAVLEDPADQTLFVMFADGTNGKGSYGGGRFLRVPLPTPQGPGAATLGARVDFNEAYNPPCAFNDFATCPLPPYQNHLTLQVTAGEKKYAAAHGGH